MIRVVLRRRRRGGGGGGGDSDSGEEDELLQHPDYSSNEEESDSEEMDNENTSERQVDTTSDQQKTYDVSLPAQHLYLGEMEEEGVASVQEEDTTLSLPLLYVPERVLFPGETVPMHIYNPHAISMLRGSFAAHKPIAVCTDLRDYPQYREMPKRPEKSELAVVGTTADIVACKQEEEAYWFGPRFIVKLMGRQRFRLLEIFKRVDGMMDCQVQILPEVLQDPRPPFLLSCPPSVVAGCQASLYAARLPDATLHSYQQAVRSRQQLWSPSSSMSLCSVPGWVLRYYDFDYLREKVVEAQQLKTITSEDDSDSRLPVDITSLSYWLSRRLPVDDVTKLKLLKMNCPTMRIIQGLRMLNEFTDLYCVKCGVSIAQKEQIFSMSVDGPLAAYVNPGGIVHDTLTVLEASNLKKSGRPSTEHSWFPGYQWTIVYCKQCRDHKGWFFEAVRKNLSPECFYGLSRSSLVLSSKDK